MLSMKDVDQLPEHLPASEVRIYLLEGVATMVQAASGVLTLAEKFDIGSSEMFCDGYPFAESFDEVFVKLAQWMFHLDQKVANNEDNL